MNFKKIPPKKSKIIMALFFVSGGIGIAIGLTQNVFMSTTMGVVNICPGGLFGWLFFTQKPHQDPRKRKRTKRRRKYRRKSKGKRGGCGKCNRFKRRKTKRRTRKLRGGAYEQYGSNIADTPSYSTPNASSLPWATGPGSFKRQINCQDNYNHYKK